MRRPLTAVSNLSCSLAAGLLAVLVATSLVAQNPRPPAPPPGGIDIEDLGSEPGSTEPAPGSVAALEAEAQREYADGNLARALELYLELAARHPEPAERARARITAAWLAFQLGDRAAAARQLADALYALPAAPFRAELYSPEFTALFQDALRGAVDRRARDASRHTALAVDRMRAGRFDEARKLLEEALALAPGDPEILYDLALVDLRQRRTDAALAGFERVLAIGRTQPDRLPAQLASQSLNNIAVLYFERGDYEVARTSLEEALELEPDDARAWFNLGLTRQRLGEAEGGHAALRRARELDPHDVDIARALAIAEIDRQEWVAAVALLLEATGERPEDPEVWFQLGRAQRGLGNAEGALQSLASAEGLDPGNRAGVAAAAALLAAEILHQRGDSGPAAEAAGRATALRPEQADGWMLLGLARYELGDLPNARRALERARELAPARADVLHNLGSVCLAQRDLAAAEVAFRAALELDSGNAEARSVLDRLAAQRAAAAATAAPPRRGPPELGADLAEVDALGVRGLRVVAVTAGGAAERAGLAVGDLILRCDGRAPGSAADLRRRAARRAGVRLELLRAGAALERRLKLD